MNRRMGIISSCITAACTILFAISIVARHYPIQYAACLFLSWAYLLTACAFWGEAKTETKPLAFASVAVGVIYSVFTNLVYFSQLATVANGNQNDMFIQSITFTSGRWMFDLDLLGYGLLALSTFLLAFTIHAKNKPDKVMKVMLWIHGLFFVSCVFMPMLGVFKESHEVTNSLGMGDIALFIWCCFFAPIMLLSALRFRRLPAKDRSA